MKNMKKVLALLVAMMLVLSMTSAFAATVTVGAIQNDQAVNHRYTAYRIFSGTVSSNNNNKLSDVQYSNGVSNTLITALQANSTLNAIAEIADLHAANDESGASAYTASTASDVAVALGKITTAAQSEALANVLNGYFTTTGSYVKHTCGNKQEDGTYQIDIGDDVGYYFVRDDQTAYVDSEGHSTTYTGATKYVLQVIGDTNITPKASVPTIDKVIVENNTEVEANSKSVGDTVSYKLKSTVPDISNYKAYTFKMQDNISDGLTLNKATAEGEHTFTVKVGNTTLVEGTDYNVTYSTTDSDDFTITFTSLYNRFKSTATADADFATGAAITVEYTATINQDAIIGEDGNDNDARIIYTNDANWDGTGSNPDGPTGETPWDKVTTFVTEIDLFKIDGNTQLPLKGVTFDITGDALQAVVTYTVSFVEATANDFESEGQYVGKGPYYKLKDGSYTTTASTNVTTEYYDTAASGKLFARTETVNSTSTKSGNPAKITMTTGDDGVIKFAGLGIGTYTIHEADTLDGYNLLTSDITVAISGTVNSAALNATTIDDGSEKITWSYAVTGASNTHSDANHITITVENRQGSTLPETGGIGTTIFYVVGGILVLAAIVLLVTKRRMNADE